MILPAPTQDVVRFLSGFQVVSGHISIDYRAYLPPDLVPLTIVRDPVAQFFSHVNHIRTSAVGPGLLADIQAMLHVSTGHFLDHATDEQLDFFENPQSKTIFSVGFPWRAVPLDRRLAWLHDTYAAVMTTETLDEELAWLQDNAAVAPGLDPAVLEEPVNWLNVKTYKPETLTPAQNRILRGLLQEDTALHHAVSRLTGRPVWTAPPPAPARVPLRLARQLA